MVAKKKRHPAHDELVARVVSQKETLHQYATVLLGVDHVDEIVVEHEVCDIFMRRQEIVSGKPLGWVDVTARSGVRILLIEVKSEREQWTAGDVIRQLKGYAKVLETRQYDRFESVLSFYCDRALTEAESTLFIHEGVHVLR
jgi:hypothetical protein